MNGKVLIIGTAITLALAVIAASVGYGEMRSDVAENTKKLVGVRTDIEKMRDQLTAIDKKVGENGARQEEINKGAKEQRARIYQILRQINNR